MWWQATINRPVSAILFFWRAHSEIKIAFHFSDFGLSFTLCCVAQRTCLSYSTFDSRCEWWWKMSPWSKWSRSLQPSEISELIVDTDSDVSSVEGGTQSVPGLSQTQPYHQTASSHESSSSIRDLFEILNSTFSKFYNPSENLAVDEVIVSFKWRVIFKQYIPNKRKRFGINTFKLCDSTGYTYDMKVYLGREIGRASCRARV
jgi:hypothetical protein